MAEERIAIFYLPTQPDSRGICPFQEYDDPRCWSKCDCEHCEEGITMQEAIERMAKGIHFYEWAHDKHFPKWNELNSDIQNDYKNMAEAALNALLEGK